MLPEQQFWEEWIKSVRRASNSYLRLEKNMVVLNSGRLMWVLQCLILNQKLGALWLIHAEQFITWSLKAENETYI